MGSKITTTQHQASGVSFPRPVQGPSVDGGRWGWVLGLALLFLPSVAWADEPGNGVYLVFGASAVQIIIALIVGGYQLTRGRLQQLADGQITDLRKVLEEERTHRQRENVEMRAQLASTRDEYSRRVDTQASMKALEERLEASEKRWKEEHKEMRSELKEMRSEVARVGADVGKIITLLTPRGQ